MRVLRFRRRRRSRRIDAVGPDAPVGVMCALCGEDVDDAGPDPCALVVVSRWRSRPAEQREQQFFAHARCLVGVLHPDARAEAHVLEPGRGPEAR